MYWNRTAIEAEQRSLVEGSLRGATQDALLDEIVRLRTALYPFVKTLGSLDDLAPRGVDVTSNLFPAELGDGSDTGKLAVHDPGLGGFRFVPIVSRDLHMHDFEERESVTVMNGPAGEDRMHDDVSVLHVHGQWVGAYADCGQVTMGDVRHAASVMRVGVGHGESTDA